MWHGAQGGGWLVGWLCVGHCVVGSAGGMEGYWVRAALRNKHREGVMLLEIENNDIYQEEEHS